MMNKSENQVEKNIELKEEDLSTIIGGNYRLNRELPLKDSEIIVDPKDFVQKSSFEKIS